MSADSVNRELRDEITARMGVFPSFFSIGAKTPGVSESLWQQAQVAYLDNPLPSLFKERLFTYVSRFCLAPYCVTRHAAFLVGCGNTSGDPSCPPLPVSEVVDMLMHPKFSREQLADDVEFLSALENRLDAWPEPRSKIEDCIFSCAVAIFLNPLSSAGSRNVLPQILPIKAYDYLLQFLSFVRLAHFWTELHPGLAREEDVQQLLSEQHELAAWLENYSTEGEFGVLQSRVHENIQGIKTVLGDLSSGQSASAESTDAAIKQTTAIADCFVALQDELDRTNRARSHLSNEKQQLQHLADTVDAFVWTLDVPSGNVQLTGSGYVRLTGGDLSTGSDRFKRWRQLVHPDQQGIIENALQSAIEGNSFEVEYRVLGIDGQTRWVSSRGVPRIDERGRVTQVSGVVCDVTVQKISKETLEASYAAMALAKDAAESADRAKLAFLANMSHELRTPLNSIIGFSSILLKELGGPLNEEQNTQVGMVKNSGMHLLELINDILDVSKIEAGTIELVVEMVDMASVVEDVVKALRPQADEKRLPVSAVGLRQLAPLSTDRVRVKQILMNLVGNAIKFTDEGEVQVSCLRTEDGSCMIKIRDTGCGIAEEDHHLLFHPFKQIRRGPKALLRGGTGLGLSISNRLAKMLGGKIQFESSVGSGSTFSLLVPAIHDQIDMSAAMQSRARR